MNSPNANVVSHINVNDILPGAAVKVRHNATVTKRKLHKVTSLAEPVPFDLAQLPANVRDTRNEILGEIRAASLSLLRIGEMLLRAHAELKRAKQIKSFKYFVASIPGLTIPTAHRHMDRWEMAQRMLPRPVRQYALVSGVDLAGTTDAKPFGKFSEAARVVGDPPKPTGKKHVDDAAAQSWVQQVAAVQAKQYRAATRKTESYTGLVKHAAEQLGRFVNRVAVDRRERYLREVVQLVVAGIVKASQPVAA